MKKYIAKFQQTIEVASRNTGADLPIFLLNEEVEITSSELTCFMEFGKSYLNADCADGKHTVLVHIEDLEWIKEEIYELTETNFKIKS